MSFLSFIRKHDLIGFFFSYLFSSFPCNHFCVFLARFTFHIINTKVHFSYLLFSFIININIDKHALVQMLQHL